MGASETKANEKPQGLTERQEKWFASVQASLERDTGKTIDEWVAIARTCPHDKPRARADWLREHHGLGVNRAARGKGGLIRAGRLAIGPAPVQAPGAGAGATRWVRAASGRWRTLPA